MDEFTGSKLERRALLDEVAIQAGLERSSVDIRSRRVDGGIKLGGRNVAQALKRTRCVGTAGPTGDQVVHGRITCYWVRQRPVVDRVSALQNGTAE